MSRPALGGLALVFFVAGCSGSESALDAAVNQDAGGPRDGGQVVDAGPDGADAGSTDAALVDAGGPEDAGLVDGGGGTTPMDLPVTFDDPSVAYGVLGFAGAERSSIVADPTDSSNAVVMVIRGADAQVFAGTTLTADETTGFASPVPLDADDTRMTLRVWSPDAGVRVRLKLEDASDPTATVETEAVTTVAAAWETLTFDFIFHAPGTPPLDVSKRYDKATVFMNFGVEGAVAGEQTYYFDDMVFIGGSSGGSSFETLTFDRPDITYTLIGFGGADDSTIVEDPEDASNNVARVVKSTAAELWAGTTTAIGPAESVPTIPLSASSARMTVRVWSPDAGIPVRLKVEDASDPTRSVETEATTTAAGAWETLTFDFTNEAPGTAALDLSYTFNKVSIFFNFGTPGAVAGEKIYFYDDIAYLP